MLAGADCEERVKIKLDLALDAGSALHDCHTGVQATLKVEDGSSAFGQHSAAIPQQRFDQASSCCPLGCCV